MDDLFQPHRNPDNVSRWVALGRHVVTAAGAPSRSRFDRWAQHEVTDIITLQRTDEMPPWLPEQCLQHDIRWHHMPLSGRRLLAATDKASVGTLVAWSQTLMSEPEACRVVVHCAAGLHRTGVALYVLMRCVGMEPELAIEQVRQARPLTGHGLARRTRRSGRLADKAEHLFQALNPVAADLQRDRSPGELSSSGGRGGDGTL